MEACTANRCNANVTSSCSSPGPAVLLQLQQTNAMAMSILGSRLAWTRTDKSKYSRYINSRVDHTNGDIKQSHKGLCQGTERALTQICDLWWLLPSMFIEICDVSPLRRDLWVIDFPPVLFIWHFYLQYQHYLWWQYICSFTIWPECLITRWN